MTDIGTERRGSQRLADLLLAEKLIRDDQLKRALGEQQKTGETLSSVLLKLELVDETALTDFFSRHYGVASVELHQLDIDAEVIGLVPVHICKKYEVLPLKRMGNALTLVMADPTNVFALDDIAFMTNLRVSPVVAPRNAIRAAIERNYEARDTTLSMETLSATASEVEVVEDAEQQRIADFFELKDSAAEAPVVRLVNTILVDGIDKGASDIHWEPYEKVFRIRFRIDGVLHEMWTPPKRAEAAVISRLKIMSNLDIAERRLPQDGRIKLRHMGREIDLRLSTMPTIFGEKAVIRILDREALKLDLTVLGFDADVLQRFVDAIKKPHGMVLITGPTGSGKTTTLYAAIATINSTDINITTAEDPVEYNLKGINQVQINEGVGRTFAAALRSFLRQDPDVILVGETRDLETAQISVRAALTGHLVFSTLHTNDCPSTITRLVDMGIPPYLVSSSLVLVVAQRLARKICTQCKEPYEVEEEVLVRHGYVPTGATGPYTLHRGKGCERCNFTGMKGRTALYEVMTISPELRDMIVHGAPVPEMRATAQEQGMKTLRDAGFAKVLEGTTTIEEILRVTITA
ncbi:MAG: type IV-A pilus assembly ATPase PilB [Candidatus Rokubacteria bacterium]|nr:type IV-A pilus assembly ATPase PilB [Candidatus Rokubacteria bacterium]MBI3825565.1 type IV-A pilus assembly ATPase PilB [Candidatus Rokubacteria bacterium]